MNAEVLRNNEGESAPETTFSEQDTNQEETPLTVADALFPSPTRAVSSVASAPGDGMQRARGMNALGRRRFMRSMRGGRTSPSSGCTARNESMNMPDKYEREIDALLRRNLDARPPRRGSVRRRRAPQLTFSERCLVIALVAACVGGGWAYAMGGGNFITGFLGLIGAACIALVALSSFLTKQRLSSTRWR